MRTFLLFLSSLIACIALANHQSPEVMVIDVTDEVGEMQECSLPKPEQNRRYGFEIETEKGYVSGFLIIQDEENEMKGCMINEFGISALDFIYSKKSEKLKLLHVISFLNKWYVKMVLKKDLRLCIDLLLERDPKIPDNYIYHTDGESFSLVNRKRHITYRIHK